MEHLFYFQARFLVFTKYNVFEEEDNGERLSETTKACTSVTQLA
jgi:hypothetical protein